jgi:16S rRNA (uracil1498-N3)-methyltransferase
MHWFFDAQLTQESITLPTDEQKHAKALRIRVGEQISITNGDGVVAIATVTAELPIGYEQLSTSTRTKSEPKLHLVQALAKNDRDEMALQQAVELGAASITPWQAERSIVRWDEKAEKGRLRWQAIALEAMKQSQQAFLPIVSPISKTKQLSPGSLGLILDPRAEISLSDLDLKVPEITLVVGPEGGISNSEIETLQGLGFVSVRLGDSVLRTSSAGPAAMAAILALSGNWS